MSFRILAINPGSTSTKLSLFKDLSEIRSVNISHDAQELMRFSSVAEQEEFRLSLIRKNFPAEGSGDHEGKLDAVIGRGGLLRPLEGGVYNVSPPMLNDLRSAVYGEHASNLGAILAQRLAEEQRTNGGRCAALIADPVVVDELDPEARISGCPEIERKSIFHALNQKSVGRSAAGEMGKSYQDLNLIIAHMGGGISVGAHCRGRIIGVNNALDGDGPFSPERSGGLPAGQLIKLALSGRFNEEELKKMITGKGGMYAYTGTKDFAELFNRIESGDSRAELVYRAMTLQIAQEISRHGATLKGDIDGIVLTGGMAKSTELVEDLKKRISFLAPVFVYPGEREMAAMAENALDVLSGRQDMKEYV